MMKSQFQIRKAQEKDSLNLCMLKLQVWLHTYATEGIRMEFSVYWSQEFTHEKVLQDLRNQDLLTLVIEKDEHLLACAQLNWKSCHSSCGAEAPELAVLYVSEHFYGQGLGYALLSEIERRVLEKNYSGLWLSVYAQNARAIAFYERLGYQCVDRIYFGMGDSKYENLVMWKNLLL